MTEWKTLDPETARDLSPARLVLHHAAQVASALGATHLEADEGHLYASLHWEGSLGALVGEEVGGLRAGVDVGELAWILADAFGEVCRLGARGHTVAEGLDWVRAEARRRGLEERQLAPVGYPLPPHPLADGAAVGEVESDHLDQLSAWFSAAALLLGEVSAARAGASDVRCWPHHFDIATLVTLDAGADPEAARSVGLGMTPGDGGIAEPYLYVSPWPYPVERTGPALPHGAWHTEGWFGAVLRGSSLGEVDQAASMRAFLAGAIEACEAMLRGR